jgi:hypothetical protein
MTKSGGKTAPILQKKNRPLIESGKTRFASNSEITAEKTPGDVCFKTVPESGIRQSLKAPESFGVKTYIVRSSP